MDLPDGPFERVGLWWLPGKAHAQVTGTYSVGSNDGATLDVHGDLGTPRPNGPGPTRVPVILGAVDGVRVSLHDLVFTSERRIGGVVTRQSFWVTTAFEGEHIASLDRAVFNGLSFTAPGLELWASKSLIEDGYRPPEGGDKGPFWYARWRDSDETSATTPRGTVDVISSTGWSTRQSELVVRQNTRVEVRASTDLDYGSLWNALARPMRDLLSTAFDEYVETEKVHVHSTNRLDEHGFPRTSRVRAHGTRRDIGQSDPDLRRFDLLFTLADIPFGEAVPKWFELDEQASVALMLLAQSRMDSSLTTRFLSAVSAAESLDRATHGDEGPPLDPAQEARINAVVEAAPEQHRRWLRRRLRGRRSVTLAARLERLVTEVSHPTWRFVPDAATWASAVTSVRNELVHGSPTATRLATELDQLHALTVTLLAVLSLSLMSRMGIPEDRISDLTVHQMRFWAFCASQISPRST